MARARPAATSLLLLLLLLSLLAVAHCRSLESDPASTETTALAVADETGPPNPTDIVTVPAAGAIGLAVPEETHAFLRLPPHARHRHHPCRHGFVRDGESRVAAAADGEKDSDEAAAVERWREKMLRRMFRFRHSLPLRHHHHDHHEEEEEKHDEKEEEGAAGLKLKKRFGHHHDDDDDEDKKTRKLFHHRHHDEDEEEKTRNPIHHDDEKEDEHKKTRKLFHHRHRDEDEEEKPRKPFHFHHADEDSDDLEAMIRRFRKAMIMTRRFSHGRRSFPHPCHHHHHHHLAEEADGAHQQEEGAGVMAWIKGLVNRF